MFQLTMQQVNKLGFKPQDIVRLARKGCIKGPVVRYNIEDIAKNILKSQKNIDSEVVSKAVKDGITTIYLESEEIPDTHFQLVFTGNALDGYCLK